LRDEVGPLGLQDGRGRRHKTKKTKSAVDRR
jgi:hypothetical protein